MAKLIPTLDKILIDRVSPTLGEWHLLNVLSRLDDSYEVYFQPMLNGDYPDIIVFKEGFGVLIIEVKDWNLRNFSLKIKDDNHYQIFFHDKVKNNDIIKKSPVSQVAKYRRNILDLYSENLLLCELFCKYNIKSSKKIANPKSLVKTAVYFHNHTQSYVDKFFRKKDNIIKFVNLLGNENSPNHILKIVKKNLAYKMPYFNEAFGELKNMINPSFELDEQRANVILSQRQKELSSIKFPEEKKIFGGAGSGKSLVLGKKAINAYERTNREVLVLHFNITLKNYIQDMISRQIRKKMKNEINIVHFHDFIKKLSNKHDITFENPKDIKNNTDMMIQELRVIKDKIRKYKTILIDEGQDFEPEWFSFIKECVLAENGSFTIFADEKQNIYNRNLDHNKKVKTNIKGRWNELKNSYRFGKNIKSISQDFLKTFTKEKVEFDNDKLDLIVEDFLYVENSSLSNKEICERIDFLIKTHKLHINDITIISNEICTLRHIDQHIRKTKLYNTTTTFETQELYDKLTHSEKNKTKLDREIKKIRKNKKFSFWQNSGKLKLSTTHSYKGWESYCVILIINENFKKDSLNELIYVGLTRAKEILYIINSEEKFNDFFAKYEIKNLTKEKDKICLQKNI